MDIFLKRAVLLVALAALSAAADVLLAKLHAVGLDSELKALIPRG